ncbi:MAG: spore germination protein [Oscillospiraceae bacterium]|jgi:spore germination protein KA|nr:spore germination protein [Oscillospiraceae bacterium]
MNNLSCSLEENLAELKAHTGGSADIVVRRAEVGGIAAAIVTVEGMVSSDAAALFVTQPLNAIKSPQTSERLFDTLSTKLFFGLEQTEPSNIREVATYAMSGFAVVLIDGIGKGIGVGVQGFSHRGVDQALTDLNLRSSRESFTEVIRTNMSLLRRRLKTPSLVMELMPLGTEVKTEVCLAYLSDKADENFIKDVKGRLSRIKTGLILESGFIQPFLEEKTSTLFSEVGYTERPDSLAAKIFEGRIAILVDGTPFALYLPKLFSENFQTMDDYSGQSLFMSMSRLLKYLAFIFTIMLPGFYCALANFHAELFPNKLLFTLVSSISSTPYPVLLECVIIHLAYEVMREAGLRMPVYAGAAVSIVGGLVIGQIVVSAGLVGAPMILIVAVAAISSFVVPDLYDTVILLRFAFLFAGGLFGLYGMIVLGIMVLMKIFSMEVYGFPFTAPMSPLTLGAMRDAFVRVCWRILGKPSANINDMYGVSAGVGNGDVEN